MIHYYTQHNYSRDEVKLACSKDWAPYGKYAEDRDSTTSFTQVTCPKCLEILIPKRQLELARMMDNLESGRRKNESGASDTRIGTEHNSADCNG